MIEPFQETTITVNGKDHHFWIWSETHLRCQEKHYLVHKDNVERYIKEGWNHNMTYGPGFKKLSKRKQRRILREIFSA